MGELSEGAVLLGDERLTVETALEAQAGTRSEKAWSVTFAVDVDRVLGRFGSWYELFPRSWGGFVGVRELLPRFAELGFDVLYLPPIHPIGVTNRKGRNNSETAEPGDVGSPWAIGSEDGGHDAIDPSLGTQPEFRALVADAKKQGIEIAIDFAIQCSPDHPWLKEHPEWFFRGARGTPSEPRMVGGALDREVDRDLNPSSFASATSGAELRPRCRATGRWRGGRRARSRSPTGCRRRRALPLGVVAALAVGVSQSGRSVAGRGRRSQARRSAAADAHPGEAGPGPREELVPGAEAARARGHVDGVASPTRALGRGRPPAHQRRRRR